MRRLTRKDVEAKLDNSFLGKHGAFICRRNDTFWLDIRGGAENLICGNLRDIANYIDGYARGHKDGQIDFANSIEMKVKE